MRNRSGIFYAKILLFGEYSILCDSMGLTIPYTHFSGELSFINNDKYTDYGFAVSSNKLLLEYSVYIRNLKDKGELMCNFDVDAFEHDIRHTLYFESTIPQGYGIGSSGALVAALYEKYVKGPASGSRRMSKDEILKLKLVFAQLESYFHGTSSGMDPLNCYIKHPLLIHNKKDISMVGIPRNKHDEKGAIFLINTGRPGKTGPLVNLFLDKCKVDDFMSRVREEMIPLNDACIRSLIRGETKKFFSSLKDLSGFLYNNLSPMIPETFKKIWRYGLDSQLFYLKLCGSGGGGFLLGFTDNFEKAKEELHNLDIDIIPVYKNFQDPGK
ncbi:MAG: mevalonate kinase [Bacteroidales bacterium]|nr:mevalonate kinase [Bacteroidales bacterium]MBK9357896.1 mevalonate kinase [Bacteroidales bacterium]